MGADKNADVVWVGTSWGASLVRINTKTMESTVVPLPHQGMSPYQITVDKNHNLWMNVWTSDVVLKYEPAANKWTTFDLPSRGTEVRHISIDERDGKLARDHPRISREQDGGDGLPQRSRSSRR